MSKHNNILIYILLVIIAVLMMSNFINYKHGTLLIMLILAIAFFQIAFKAKLENENIKMLITTMLAIFSFSVACIQLLII